MIPEAALSQHVAIYGKTGSGKTYRAKALVEQILEAGRRLVVIDPTGAWWGLRSSADGKSPGFAVVVLGGQHADAPLPPASGEACAKLVTGPVPQAIFDTSDMSVGERTRWFTEFATAIFRLNRSPLHLVIDEAHMFAPQGGGGRMDVDAGKMLHAANTLASGGRSRGVRLVLITQRPAKLHKDSATCCDTMIAMRVIAPQDRDAIRAWVDGCADPKKGKEVLDSLATLERGEAWTWYPEGGFLERAKGPKIRTFDSSATPVDGQEHPVPKSMAEIDLGAVRQVMEAAIEEAKANDVVELRKQIKDLKQQLSEARALPAQVVQPADIEEQLEAARRCGVESVVDHFAVMIGDLKNAHTALREDLVAFDAVVDSMEHIREKWGKQDQRNTPAPRPASVSGGKSYAEPPVLAENGSIASVSARASGTTPRASAGQSGPRGGRTSTPAPKAQASGRSLYKRSAAERVLDSLAWWAAAGVRDVERAPLAYCAGYSPKSSGFDKTVSSLSSSGLVEYPDDGMVRLTPEGAAQAIQPEDQPSCEEVQRRTFEVLGADSAAARVLRTALKAYPDAISRADLAEGSNYSASSSGFEKTVSTLRTAGLIEYPGDRMVRACTWLNNVVPAKRRKTA